MICIHHNDDDGKCAGAIVMHHGKRDEFITTCIEMNYGYDFPFKMVHEDEIVYIVDFSLEPEDLFKLMKITSNIIWIDHHISAINKYKDFPHHIEGIRDINHSGCLLTYQYLMQPENYKDIPLIVKYCDDYDMWRFDLKGTKNFHMGFSIVSHEPENSIWDKLLSTDFEGTKDLISDIILQGEAITRYRSQMMESLVKSYGYSSTINGYTCFVLNQGLISSNDFESIEDQNYPILVGYIYDGSKYSYSLRSTDVNVAKIAEMYGGGGHEHAAGFSSKTKIV